MIIGIAIVVLMLAAAVRLASALRAKNVDLIVRAHLARRPEAFDGTRHVFFSIVDHFEPYWHNDDSVLAAERVRRWHDGYPAIAERFQDGGGCHPRHAFFYPQEEYPRAPELMESLARLTRAGFGDVEVHLHHDRDTSASLREKLVEFTHALRDRHGLLRPGPNGDAVAYAFIHGNWVLGNSGHDGEYCGVDDEWVVLRETGCYADFTLPSAPHPSQPPVINRIGYAAGDPRRPRAHYRLIDARFGQSPPAGPMLVTGPLALNWHRRRRGVFPAVENGDLTGINPPSPDRVDRWIDARVSVSGFPRWIFVKAYTHGAQERNSARLLGEGSGSLGTLFGDLMARYNDGTRYVLHFSTPWEIFRAVRVLEAGDQAAIDAIERFEYPF